MDRPWRGAKKQALTSVPGSSPFAVGSRDHGSPYQGPGVHGASAGSCRARCQARRRFVELPPLAAISVNASALNPRPAAVV